LASHSEGMIVITSTLGPRALARRVAAALVLAALAFAGCADPRHPVGLAITGSDAAPLTYTQRLWLGAWEVYSDGTYTDVTAATEWVSSDPTVATVANRSYDAEVTALQPGLVVVTATYREFSSSVHFTVPPP